MYKNKYLKYKKKYLILKQKGGNKKIIKNVRVLNKLGEIMKTILELDFSIDNENILKREFNNHIIIMFNDRLYIDILDSLESSSRKDLTSGKKTVTQNYIIKEEDFSTDDNMTKSVLLHNPLKILFRNINIHDSWLKNVTLNKIVTFMTIVPYILFFRRFQGNEMLVLDDLSEFLYNKFKIESNKICYDGANVIRTNYYFCRAPIFSMKPDSNPIFYFGRTDESAQIIDIPVIIDKEGGINDLLEYSLAIYSAFDHETKRPVDLNIY
jgi:hypothetical protein